MREPHTTNEIVKESITQALLEMMRETPLEKIAVTDLVKKAGVGRISFYRNFGSKEDVIVRHLERLTKEWGKRFEEIGKPDFVRSLFQHFSEQRELLGLLYQSGLSHLFFRSIYNICGPKAEQDNPVAYWQAMISGALIAWCDEWIKRGMPETPKEMEDYFKHISNL